MQSDSQVSQSANAVSRSVTIDARSPIKLFFTEMRHAMRLGASGAWLQLRVSNAAFETANAVSHDATRTTKR
jgi:hypothetical protein